jgi:hypothetical protein
MAFCAAARPCSRTGTGRAPPNGLPQRLIATPQCAIAQDGSFSATAAERLRGGAEPERVQQRHGAVEVVLHGRVAGRLEMDDAEPLRRLAAFVLMLERGRRLRLNGTTYHPKDDGETQSLDEHGTSSCAGSEDQKPP